MSGWWAIAEDELLKLLERAAAGEEPGALLAEYYANSKHEHYERPEETSGPEQ